MRTLDLFVGDAGEQGKICGVSPETALEHFFKVDLLRGYVPRRRSDEGLEAEGEGVNRFG